MPQYSTGKGLTLPVTWENSKQTVDCFEAVLVLPESES